MTDYLQPTPICEGMRVRFDYPTDFVTLPEYTAHAGQIVSVVRMLTEEEADIEVGPMWEIRADDGWTGHAFDDELQPPMEGGTR